MEPIKCKSCGRLLFKIGRFDELEVKCPRCKTLNYLSVTNATKDCHEQPVERSDATGQTNQSV
ncbi:MULTISPECIES: Com family DNA-binding transcriptional regulator [unclassified Acinetobacter]|uniref:Com family DNA-binding transcriptional regulator n=1 Tax=unclassified Acinetobacter TaxID=196816 RepID=UPI00190A62DC|nr:Com family DNA-binding transcriptional regulator [Acinetobacter sp. S55]MBK0066201.1 Com family DNA-binding transcriptional regulator [Acinetobacter sp. S54]